jgi:hypothetical protein
VLLDDARRVAETARRADLGALAACLEAWRPDVVCIDSPPGWAVGQTRATEAAVLGLGLQLYRTPWDALQQAKAFYAWMLAGFAAFEAARVVAFAMYDGGPSVEGRALEVFPHATASVLGGSRRPREVDKHVWRREVLTAAGVETAALRGNDQVDAALCALTGLLALEGCFCWAGEPSEGVIVLPCPVAELPGRLPWASGRALAMMATFR